VKGSAQLPSALADGDDTRMMGSVAIAIFATGRNFDFLRKNALSN
jgi:hypothetical protein